MIADPTMILTASLGPNGSNWGEGGGCQGLLVYLFCDIMALLNCFKYIHAIFRFSTNAEETIEGCVQDLC